VSIFGELASDPPPAATLTAPALLLHAPAYGLVRDEQLAAYAEHAAVVAVPGLHMVMWDAFDEVADAVEAFLSPQASS
jgi:pimeloyl-ACP methyl ester carboxylesterase